jgi:hypothetical protein
MVSISISINVAIEADAAGRSFSISTFLGVSERRQGRQFERSIERKTGVRSRQAADSDYLGGSGCVGQFSLPIDPKGTRGDTWQGVGFAVFGVKLP